MTDESQRAQPLRIGVYGAGGKMGTATCRAVELDPEVELVATVGRDGGASDFRDARCQVVVDFSVADGTRKLLPQLAADGIHAVVGTTGLSDGDIDSFRTAFERGGARCLIAANFSISAVLMTRFAELAAPWFDTAEIIELHHDRKIDAPSGTATTTARRMAAASDAWAPDPTQHELLAGARGGTAEAGIRVHSVRMRGMVAHQEVILGALGQTLTIRQDSYDRESYMPGVLLSCKHVANFPEPVTIGLDQMLGL